MNFLRFPLTKIENSLKVNISYENPVSWHLANYKKNLRLVLVCQFKTSSSIKFYTFRRFRKAFIVCARSCRSRNGVVFLSSLIKSNSLCNRLMLRSFAWCRNKCAKRQSEMEDLKRLSSSHPWWRHCSGTRNRRRVRPFLQRCRFFDCFSLRVSRKNVHF